MKRAPLIESMSKEKLEIPTIQSLCACATREGQESTMSSTAPHTHTVEESGLQGPSSHPTGWRGSSLTSQESSKPWNVSLLKNSRRNPQASPGALMSEILHIHHGNSSFSSPEPSRVTAYGSQPGQSLLVRVGSENWLQGSTAFLSLEVQLRFPGWSSEVDPSSPWTRLNRTSSEFTQSPKPTVKSHCFQKTLHTCLPAQVTSSII